MVKWSNSIPVISVIVPAISGIFPGISVIVFFLPKNVKPTKIHNQQLLLTTECNFFQVNMSYIGTIALEADLIQPNWKGSMFSILVEY